MRDGRARGGGRPAAGAPRPGAGALTTPVSWRPSGFTGMQAAGLEAVVDRLIPPEDLGPRATDRKGHP